jgi:hypothetical protein
MLNSHSIPSELWAQARERLIFFFSRRLGLQNAEDLAHNTLLAIWVRNDFEFIEEEDFFKVCYGFARNILLEGYRDMKNQESVELHPEMKQKILGVQGLQGSEAAAFLREVIKCGEELFDTEEWALIEAATNRDANDAPISSQHRTKMHRIRKKLAELTGWRRSEV